MKEDHCVDYLSYEWDFDDLMETYKKSCCKSEYSRVEQMRFKNALWRSMSIKSKKDLIDPSTIHWQKESDITWLYGPLYTKRKIINQQKSFKLIPLPSCSDSSSNTMPTNHIVHFNPEIIEIQYQPESPIQLALQVGKEDELWALVLQFILSLNRTFLKFILSYRRPLHLLSMLSRKHYY